MSMPGPFFFAWVDAVDSVWDEYGSFARQDETIVQAEVSQEEGDFAALVLDIRNPKIGLLTPTRKVWAWFSWDRAWRKDENNIPDIVPLFFGRLVGIPSNINQEIITLTFTARPQDYEDQKATLAETLKVFPYYDPIFIADDKVDDPDTVLEARSQLWAIDRVTHEVTVSDILQGEDGLEDFQPDEVPYDSVAISLGDAPLRSVTIHTAFNWTQAGTGAIPITDQTFETYTGGSLMSAWPKTGASLGKGWSVASATFVDVWNVNEAFTASYSSSYQNIDKKHNNGDTMSSSISSTTPVLQGPGNPYLATQVSGETQTGSLDPSTGYNVGAHANANYLYVLRWLVRAQLSIAYDAKRARKENITFTLETNVQDIVTDAAGQDTLILNPTSRDVSLPLPGQSFPPIGVTTRGHFLATTRGILSLQYLIALARANLIARSRVVKIEWDCKFERAIELSCRKNARLFDDRLPGGVGLGKIVGYAFHVNGESGEQIGRVSVACAIGKGGSVAEVTGTPTYCDADYVGNDYQVFDGQVVVLDAGDVGYTVPFGAGVDDGFRFPLTKSMVVAHEEWHGSLEDQAAVIQAAFPAEGAVANFQSPFSIEQKAEQDRVRQLTVAEQIKAHAIWYELELKPVQDIPFTNGFEIAVTQLQIPKQIDLEAG